MKTPEHNCTLNICSIYKSRLAYIKLGNYNVPDHIRISQSTQLAEQLLNLSEPTL